MKFDYLMNSIFRPSISVGYGAKDFGFQNILLEDQINVF